jgi:hypothetical protein
MYAKRRIFLLLTGLTLLAGCADPSYSDGLYQPSGYYQQPVYGQPVYGQPGYSPPAYYPGGGYYSGPSSYRVIERIPEHGQRVYRESPPQPPPRQQVQVQQPPRPQVQVQPPPPPPRDPGCGPGGRRNCEFGAGQNGK